ncbi:hypothetical protein L209DRAFT_773869 [Thermothelomyces heterothallicus CBS 203.75]
MFGETNRATPSRTTSGGAMRSVSSSNRGSGNGHATNSSVTATRHAASVSGPSTHSSTASTTTSSTTSSTGNGSRSGGSARSTSNRNDKKDEKDGTEEEERPEYQKLYVIVFKGASYDSYNKRHCALTIEHRDYADKRWRLNTVDIEGAERMWRVRESVNWDPWNSRTFYGAFLVKSFMVGHGAQGRNDRRLRDSIYNARIDNEDPEWNCQSWLEGALHRLRAARFLTNEEAEAAISAALDIVLEAPREPISLYY